MSSDGMSELDGVHSHEFISRSLEFVFKRKFQFQEEITELHVFVVFFSYFSSFSHSVSFVAHGCKRHIRTTVEYNF